MKKCTLVVSLCAVLSLPTFAQTSQTSAPQSVNWEHTLTTRSSRARQAIAKLKIFNNWTPSRHRLMVKYNVLGLGAQSSFVGREFGPSFSMPNFDPARMLRKAGSYHHGTLGVIERLDDDRVLAYSSEAGSYFVEPRHALMKRLRFDPWKKIAPELSKDAPPSLTLEQRARLGREVRSLTRPFLKHVFRAYFRALPETRTFNVSSEPIVARGYRLTMMLNAGSEWDPRWMRINAEWWLANSPAGDEIMQQFIGKKLADWRKMGGFTTSMWLNEMIPVLWQTLPQELHQAVATLLPQGIANAESTLATGGTPVYAGFTVIPPKGEERLSEQGTVRVELQLQKSDTRALTDAVFDAPPEYKKESLEPILKEWDSGMEMIQSAFDDEMRLSDARTSSPKYSWKALHDYLRAAGGATPAF